MRHPLKDWIFATRPWSLTASSMPALIAIAYIYCIRNCFTDINWGLGITALLAAVIFQIGGNLLNDYFDYKYKVDREDTYSSRSLVDGIFEPKTIYRFGIISLAVGSLIGGVLLFFSGWHLIWIGLLGILGAYFYNRMKYVALGDFVIFIIYGLLISFGVVYVMTDQLYWPILLITTPIGLLIVAILHANNTRDILNDGKADIKTMAMLLGLKTSKIYFVLLNAGAYIGVICLVLFKLSHPLTFLVFLTLPPVIKNISQIVAVKSEAELDKIKTLTEQEAKLVALFAILQATSYFIIGSI